MTYGKEKESQAQSMVENLKKRITLKGQGDLE